MRPNLTQDSLIEALRQIRRTYRALPTIAWEISPNPSAGLRGSIYTAADDRPVLEAYASALGGEVTAAHQYTDTHWGPRQVIQLRTQFAEVPVEIRGAYPAVAAVKAVA